MMFKYARTYKFFVLKQGFDDGYTSFACCASDGDLDLLSGHCMKRVIMRDISMLGFLIMIHSHT